MATTVRIPLYDDDPSSLEDFLSDMQTYFLAINLSVDNDAGQCAAQLLCQAGPKVRRMVEANKTVNPKQNDENQYQYVIRIIREKELPKKNNTYESYVFRKIVQRDGESFQSFIQRLECQVNRCEYTDRDRQLKDQVVLGCVSENLRKVALREDPNLQRLLELGKTEEYAVSKSNNITSNENTENTAYRTAPRKVNSWTNANQPIQSQNTNRGQEKHCHWCGSSDLHGKNACPARDKQCLSCKGYGHFARVCKNPGTEPSSVRFSRGARQPQNRANNLVQEADDGEFRQVTEEFANAVINDEFVFNVQGQDKLKSPCSVLVDTNVPVDFIPDTGASVNIVDFDTYTKLKQHKHYPLLHTNTRIFAYGSTSPLPLKGMFVAKLSCNNASVLSNIYVLHKHKCGNLLSKDSCMKLNLLKFNDEVANNTTEIFDSAEKLAGMLSQINTVLDRFPEGIGKLKNYELHLHVDPNVKPVAQRRRPVPLSEREFVSEQTAELLKNDIIEEVTGTSTEWVSPIHIVHKDGKRRMTIDMRMANEAISRVRKPIPLPDEVLTDLNGSCFFSKIDLNSAYLQIPLTQESRFITTFQTHEGLYRYKRLFFGVTSASEEFQGVMSKVLSGIPGCRNIADDIIVFGKSKEEHDEALHNVLTRLLESGLTINRSKCKFRKSSVDFFGFEVSDKGIKPLIKDSLINMPKPTDKAEVRSYVGMVNFISRFIPRFSTKLAPISNLLSKDLDFVWGPEQDHAFNTILEEIKSPRILCHFDPSKRTEITTDASPVGISAILSQEGRPVKFISRKLTSVETRYSQTEREALAVVWACEKLHYYLYGIEFTVNTDHVSLKTMYAPEGKPCARVLRWALRLLPYKFKIKHIPGVTNPADYFSRKPLQDASPEEVKQTDDTEGFVNSILASSTPNSISVQEVLSESLRDPIFQEVVLRLKDSQWHKSPHLSQFKSVKNELCEKNGLIMKENRLTIPKNLRSRCLQLAHCTHMGIDKTKRLLRSKIWWPGIDKDVTEMINECGICASVNPEGLERLEPLKIRKAPDKPFSTVHVDLFGPLESGETILGIIDELSRWPELYVLGNIRTQDVIGALDKTFGRFGNPETLTSDNGPQFRSWEFKNYLEKEGIRHHLTTPYYPQSNSSIERFFKTLKKFLKVCTLGKQELSKKLDCFLKVYRNTPIRATGYSPAEMILNYTPNIGFPNKIEKKEHIFKDAQRKDIAYKEKTKIAADKEQKRKTVSLVKAGDKVLVKYPDKGPKSRALFDPKPFVVTSRIGNRVYVERNGNVLCRPLNHLKRVPDNIRIKNFQDSEMWVPTLQQPNREAAVTPGSPNRNVQHQTGLRSTINIDGFRQRALGRVQITYQQMPPAPPLPMPQIYTGSGRISRPVMGSRLIDQLGT